MNSYREEDMAPADIEDILARIRAQMDLDTETEHEVLEEVRSHLEEAVEAAWTRGLDESTALAEVAAYFGVEEVGIELQEVHAGWGAADAVIAAGLPVICALALRWLVYAPDGTAQHPLGPHVGPPVLLILIVLVILVNIPVNRHGTSLARVMPDTAALVIRDGLVLKGSGPEIYVLEDNKLRWISSLEAFEFFGYRWEQVHIVDDEFLEEFEKGRPIHMLLKCQSSPHIYALENGKKRWIKDIPTFEAEGYVWDDVKFVGCNYLRNLPDGSPIPENAGPPPQP